VQVLVSRMIAVRVGAGLIVRVLVMMVVMVVMTMPAVGRAMSAVRVMSVVPLIMLGSEPTLGIDARQCGLMGTEADQFRRRDVTLHGTADPPRGIKCPQALLKRQSRREMERAVMEMRSSGFGEDEIQAQENRLRQNVLKRTENLLKEHFILERIAEQEKVEDQPEDYDREIARIAMQKNDSPRRVRARFERSGSMDTLRNMIIEQKVISLIEQHATREVLELRFAPGAADDVAPTVADVGDRIEILPDRILIYVHDGDATLAEVHRRGIEPVGSLVRRSSLEDVFLRLTGRTLVD